MRLPKLKPILGHLLNVLAAASLLLAIVVGSLWWQSYQNPEHYWVSYRSGGIDAVKTDRGEFAIARRRTNG